MNEVLFNKHMIYDTNVIIRLYSYTYSYTYRRMTLPYSLHKTHFTLYFFSVFSSNIFMNRFVIRELPCNIILLTFSIK